MEFAVRLLNGEMFIHSGVFICSESNKLVLISWGLSVGFQQQTDHDTTMCSSSHTQFYCSKALDYVRG